MKKIISKEVEYVGIEDVQELVELVYEVQQAGHFAKVEFGNCGYDVNVHIMLGGFDVKREYDYTYSFDLGENERYTEEMNACKHVLNSIIVESEEK